MKKILLSLAVLLTGVGAWAQEYDLTTFEVTTDLENPVTYVIESRRSGYGYPDWFLNDGKVRIQQHQEYAKAEGANKNKFLFYFTEASSGKYYIHPYAAEKGYVLGVEGAAENAQLVLVDKDDTGKIAIEWTIGTLTGDGVTRPYFKTTLNGTNYCIQDGGDNPSDGKIVLDSSPGFRATALNFGKRDPYVSTAQDALTDAINAFEYKIAYQCLGDEEGQFVDAGDAYKTAYEAAQAAITAGTGEFETLLENVQTTYAALVYAPFTTEKFYTFKSKSTSKYLAPNAPGSAMSMSDDIAVFELTAETWMEMCTNGIWINGVNHGRGGDYHNTNEFYRVADGSVIIAATPTGETTHVILKADATKLTSVADNAIDDACYWVIEEYTVPTVNIDATAEYATFCAPVAVGVPEGVTAYYVSNINGNSATLTEIETNIPANTGAILYADGGKECNFVAVSYNAEDAVSGNCLVGTNKETTVTKEEGSSYYVLAKNEDGVVGFYQAVNGTDTNTFINAAGKAYLKVTEEAEAARFLTFDFGTETAIESIQGAESANAVVYDLAGRRVKGAQKGLYIVNGKVVIK